MEIENDFYRALMFHTEELRTLLGAKWPQFKDKLQRLKQAIADGDHDLAKWLMDGLLAMGLDSPAAPVIQDLFRTVEAKTRCLVRSDTSEALQERSDSRSKRSMPKTGASGDTAKAPQVPTQGGIRPEFLFRLEGNGVYESSVLAETEALLVFYLGKPDQGTIAIVKASKLDEVLANGGELGIFIVPVGYKISEGDCYQKAVIKDWEMPEVVFKLKAGAVPNPQAGAWLYLYLQETLIYAFFLEIPVIEDASQAKRLPTELPALDLEDIGVPTQARLCITQDGDELLISYQNSKSGFCMQKTLKELTLPKLEKILENVSNLANTASGSGLWLQFPDPFIIKADDSQQRGLDEVMKQVAKAGWDLWISLTNDTLLKEILGDLDKLPPTSRIDIVTDSVFLPWEIIYPENVNVLGLKPGLFWGARYIIQSTLQDKINVPEEKRLHQACASQALICINPAIDEDNKFFDLDPKPGASHVKLTNLIDQVVFLAKPAEVKQILLEKKEVKKWIYFFCHGRGGTNEALDLGGGEFIGPDDLNDTVAFNCRPIVFLNSCSSGAYAPLLLNNFYKTFRKSKKILGLIGTSFPVPAVTAAAIGQRLTEEYMAGEKDLGTILFEIRQKLIENRVPIGLFYTLHCYADIRAVPR